MFLLQFIRRVAKCGGPFTGGPFTKRSLVGVSADANACAQIGFRQRGQSQQTELEATGLASANDLEPALVHPAPPAAYTAIVRGRNNTGVALV